MQDLVTPTTSSRMNFLTTGAFHFPTLDRRACNSYVKVSWRLEPLCWKVEISDNSLTGEGLPLYHLQWFADGRDHRWRMDIPREGNLCLKQFSGSFLFFRCFCHGVATLVLLEILLLLSRMWICPSWAPRRIAKLPCGKLHLAKETFFFFFPTKGLLEGPNKKPWAGRCWGGVAVERPRFQWCHLLLADLGMTKGRERMLHVSKEKPNPKVPLFWTWLKFHEFPFDFLLEKIWKISKNKTHLDFGRLLQTGSGCWWWVSRAQMGKVVAREGFRWQFIDMFMSFSRPIGSMYGIYLLTFGWFSWFM